LVQNYEKDRSLLLSIYARHDTVVGYWLPVLLREEHLPQPVRSRRQALPRPLLQKGILPPGGPMKAAALFLSLTLACGAYPNQVQPSPKRVHEIQEALRAHGFKPGETWHDTQEACRDIQREHHWQTHFAPDARVLILIGLGNKYSDPEVLMNGSNHLDSAQGGNL
jgi:hypothetical protein